MIDFRMETFLCVCEYMNFTRAAEKLGLSQPAVSQHIKYLENEYETELFTRDKKKLKLTASGEILRNALLTMRNDEITLKKRIHEEKNNNKAISFGVTMTIGEYAVIPAISEYIKRHKNINFNIRYGNTKKLLNYLDHGKIDFAIVEGYFDAEQYSSLNFSKESYIAVCSSKHIFEKPVNCINDLTSERLITRESGSGTRSILTRSLAVKNMDISSFKHIIEVENIHSMVSLLLNDCGIAFLYKAAVKEEIKKGRLMEIPLIDFNITHEFTFLWNKDSMFGEEYIGIFNEIQMINRK